MPAPRDLAPELWPEALATVLSCTYQFGAGRALAFGIPTSRHFRISFNYHVDGELYTGQFSAPKPLPQGTLFPITYNPEAPQQNSHGADLPAGRAPVLLIGVIGSVVLSLAWLAVLHGCH